MLGPATVKRSSANIAHIRPFAQLMWLAYFAQKLVQEKKTSTLRDVFYSAQAFDVEFVDQAESDELITDLEVLTHMAREGLNIYPEERSAIFGNMTIEYTVPGYEGKKLDLSSHPDGVMIGPALTTAEFRDTSAEMVLAIEKGGLFTRFVEEQVHKRYKAILVNTAGQPPRSTRYLLRRLNQELGLPIGILCDADPWGAHIAMVIKSGSANAAHLRELTTPGAVWLGVWASDIVKYKLPSDKLTEVDIKRLYELKADPRYTDRMWHEELDTFLKIKKKSEQEAFARYGLSYIVDTYLPAKLELMKSA
ncbi:MAG: DNA topoisomerase IV subunit A [Nitrososphaerales archaeon]|nr:DNA topoisomerase IV subunit A [Nitrososphaerales archaeon]